ncbi:hypothetical protein [Glycomyces salinus]|uniref:hypothetical protein n=1 Tax=Glycomyces salinus TaxID=980294 RepID=UPI0018EB9332|nr:hypothetical protein [Glycomyces salinus]
MLAIVVVVEIDSVGRWSYRTVIGLCRPDCGSVLGGDGGSGRLSGSWLVGGAAGDLRADALLTVEDRLEYQDGVFEVAFG